MPDLPDRHAIADSGRPRRMRARHRPQHHGTPPPRSTRLAALAAAVAMVAATALTVSGATVASAAVPAPAQAPAHAPTAARPAAAPPAAPTTVPGHPGVPQPPTTVYSEDFQHLPASGIQSLGDYVGATGQTYTADPYWLDRTDCNGFVLVPTAALNDTDCSTVNGHPTSSAQYQVFQETVRDFATDLGIVNGSADPSKNGALAELANSENPTDPASNIQFRTTTPIPMAASTGRYLVFSVNAVATTCGAGHPKLTFSAVSGGVETPLNATPIDPCSSPGTTQVAATSSLGTGPVFGGSFTSDGSVLVNSGDSNIGLILRNVGTAPNANGNDGAIDDIKILDATPQLDKSFSPASIHAGQTSTLTFTVTNTDELAAKDGWSLSDSLPAGLVLADPTAAATTCPSGTVTAAAGGTTVKVSGDLSAGMKSCTATVTVTSTTVGSYTNGPGNVTETGLNPPGPTTLIVTEPPAWQCTAYGYLFQSPSAGPDAGQHLIQAIDLATGAVANTMTMTDPVNAVGFNALDKFFYAWDGGIVRINADGTVNRLPLPSGIADTFTTYIGDVDSAGHYWVMGSVTNGDGSVTRNVYYEVDYAPGSPTNGQLISHGTFTFPADLTAIGLDWVWDKGKLYGTAVDAAGNYVLTQYLPTGAGSTVTDLGEWAGPGGHPVGYPAGTTIGALYADAAGDIFASVNESGEIYRITPSTRATLDLGKGPVATFNDGARCADAPIPTITVTKKVADRVQPGDQFTVGLQDSAGAVLTSATTAAADTTASTPDWPVSPNTGYTITDAMAAGSPDALSAYTATAACTDTATGDAVPTTGSGPSWGVTSTGGDPITCTITNAPATPSFSVTKKASVEMADQGDTVTYTLTVHNTGTVPYTDAKPASLTDDLTGVLDDATYSGDATASAGTVGYAAPTLSWSGALPVDATVTITYSVTVNKPDTGDHHLRNTVHNPPGSGGSCAGGTADPGCATDTPIRSYTLKKTASTTVAHPGQTVTYTVTVTNTGQVAYTGSQLRVVDDMSGALDDATYGGDATVTSGSATLARPLLIWTVPLAIGATETLTYTMKVDDPDTGDGTLDNVLVTYGGGTCPTGTTDPSCATHTPVGSYTVAKSASTTVAHPGDKITYTVTVTNTGHADYTAADPAGFTDDLTNVLDDATYDKDATASAGEVTYGEPILGWSGPLPVGGVVTVTYSVTVNDPDTGDGTLVNAADPLVPPPGQPPNGGACAGGTAAPCTPTEVPVQSYAVTKTADRTAVIPGQKITYTVTVTNTGQVDYTADHPASFTDDLGAVLDDAAYDKDATATAGDVSYAAPTLSWSGALAVGATVTVTYSVTVNHPDSGDLKLANAVVTPPGVGGNCAPGSTDPRCTTLVPAWALTVRKSASSQVAAPGKKITYTVTVTNSGQAAFTADHPASFTDDLTGVLDDAAYDTDAAATGGTVHYAAPTLSWSGALAVGKSVTVTYSVTVADPDAGDRVLRNTVMTPPGVNGNCATGSTDPACATATPVAEYTVKKVASAATVHPGDTVTYTVTVTNTGTSAYTADHPASFTDDLTQVLDDASFDGDAAASSGTVHYAEPVLSWSGAVPVGGTVTVTYSVTVLAADGGDSGDDTLRNVVVTPDDPDGDTVGNCPAGSGNPDCTAVSSVEKVAPVPPTTAPPTTAQTTVPAVTPPTGRPPLSYTGTDTAWQLSVAALLLLGGGLLVLVARRRRRHA